MVELWSNLSPQALAGYVKHCGTRSSCGRHSDSDAQAEDPEARNFRSVPSTSSAYLTGTQRGAIEWGLDQFLSIAKTVSAKDKIVVFGRDCYFALGLRVISHKLRGQWFYAEGVSRNVCRDERLIERLSGMTVAIDTGFRGTIPERATPKARAILLSTEEGGKGVGPYSAEGIVRDAAVELEHLPKAFLRSVCTFAGKPNLALAERNDILVAMRVISHAEEYCNHVWKSWLSMPKEDWDKASHSRLVATMS